MPALELISSTDRQERPSPAQQDIGDDTSTGYRRWRARVLLVQADADTADQLTLSLRLASGGQLTVNTTPSLSRAIFALAEGEHDVVLLDLDLPEGGGVPAVKALRRAVPTTPVIVLSALKDSKVALEAIRAGAEEYLVRTEIPAHAALRVITYVVERHRAARKIQEMERIAGLGRVAASVAHEFNNVLMGIQPFVDLINRRNESLEVESAITRIRAAIHRGKRVSQEILRYAHPATPETEVFELQEWLRGVVDEQRPQLGRIAVQMELPHEPLYVDADRHQLAQAIVNLVMNARDAMAASGILTIQASTADSRRIRIAISDTGSGIPTDVLSRIFEPFFTTKPVGTGLGLSVCHQVAIRHGGDLTVTSQVGKGTTFTLVLPRAKGRPAAHLRPLPVLDASLDGKRVVLVDDEEAIVAGVTALLESEGVIVRSTSTGRSVPDIVAQFQPHAVILDIGLPDLSGLEVHRQLREQHPDLPLLFCTGQMDARAMGGVPKTTLLAKPYEFSDLRQALIRMLT